MNDFRDIERDLKKLRPAAPSVNLFQRVEDAMVDFSGEEKIVRPHQFRVHWLSLGASLAAAAVIVIFLRFDFRRETPPARSVASQNAPLPASAFIPAAATHVVYDTRNEGLYFARNSEQPMRRVRSLTKETWQWRNPATGASLQVSYPAERVELIPAYGQ